MNTIIDSSTDRSPCVGDKAPDFALPTADGKTVSLADMKKKGATFILYFYPKDDTPGCTTEACEFRDAKDDLVKSGLTVIGVSRDNGASHRKFAEKYGLNFTLASDETGEVCEKYGVWQERSMYGKKFMGIERSTFLIDGKGIVRAVWRKVSVTGHAAAVLQAAKSGTGWV